MRNLFKLIQVFFIYHHNLADYCDEYETQSATSAVGWANSIADAVLKVEKLKFGKKTLFTCNLLTFN